MKKTIRLRPSDPLLTHYEFLKLFREAEQEDIIELEALIEDDSAMRALCPNISAGQESIYRKPMRRGFRLFNAATGLDLKDPNTMQFVTMFETVGLLATGRAAEILG